MVFYTTYVRVSDTETELLTITKTKGQAKEYILEYLRYKNYEHFKIWCELHNEDVDSYMSLDRYIANVIGYEVLDTDFITVKTKIKKNRLYGIIRLLNGCMPLNTSYQTIDEDMYLESLAEEQEQEEKTDSILVN